MELWELSARESIRDTMARYNHSGDAGRFDAMVDCFCADGVIDIVGGERHEGHEALRAFFSGVGGSTSRTNQLTVLRHSVNNVLIDIDSATTARSRAYFHVLTDIGLDHWGSYRDEFRDVDGRWLFSKRSVKTDAYMPGSFFQ